MADGGGDEAKESTEPGPVLDATLKRTLVSVGAVGLALSLAAAVFGAKSVISVLAGTVTALVNLLAFAFLTRTLLSSRASGAYALFALLKIIALFGGLFVLFRSNLVSVLAFAVGYGSLLLGISAVQLFGPAARS